MGKYFGTDGFRGEANGNLTAEHAFRIGRFLGYYLGKKKGERAKVVIGKDTRRSGYMFEYALAGGLVSSGADAYLLHVTTTPSVAYVTRTDGFDAGVMISASHNSFYDNGIKLFNEHGEKMDESTITLIENDLDKITADGSEYCEPPYATGENIGRTVDYVAGRNRYVGYLISLGVYSFKGIKVGLDCANGSAWNIAKTVFDALGAKTYVTGVEPDGTNINRAVGSTHIENLQKFVVDNGLDVGFAYDGDADRCLCVDDKGNLVDGDQIMYLYGRYLHERGKLLHNTVVTTVMSNFGLYKAFDEIGILYEKTPVGDKYVYERMASGGFSLGGEQSGHIIFSKYATTGDGILTSLKIMQAMIDKKSTLSQLVAPMKVYPQVLKNVRVKDKKQAREDKDVCAAVEKVAKALGDSGRVLVRESGTEPLIRVMVEAESEEICQSYVDEILAVIEAKGHKN
ncbi:MAG: phosphoglucosamine mutase [Clostridia bacterium]|nr:phosphoglucosamine mutase [Clostridia bacterium]